MSQEDELAKAVMEQTDGNSFNEYKCRPEVHYNHYGSRGVVDLVEIVRHSESDAPNISIYEFKSESAVRNSTGANEIIRQFNRHKKSFFKGSKYNKGRFFDVSFELAFYATDYNLRHIRENASLYRSIEDSGEFGEEKSYVSVRHPEVEGNAHPLKEIEMRGEKRWHQEWFFTGVLTEARPIETGDDSAQHE